MIKAVVVAKEERVCVELVKELNELLAGKISVASLPLSRDINGSIKAAGADLLVTLNLAGFDRVTLTDHIAYNLLDCKQVHIIQQREPETEDYLKKPLSIAMFLGIADAELYKHLQCINTGIPWMKYMEGWQENMPVYNRNNAGEIAKIIEAVLQECKM